MTERTYINTTTELDRVELSEGVFLVKEQHQYGYSDKPLNEYTGMNLDGLPSSDIQALSILASVLQNLPEEGALGFDYDELLDFMKEWAADTAESAELPFTFTERDGTSNTYSPAALWESSGGCEWEQSAQEGYDYGWNI